MEKQLKNLSEEGTKFLNETNAKIHEFDLLQQNIIIEDLVSGVLTTRKATFEKISCERDEFAKRIDELTEILKSL